MMIAAGLALAGPAVLVSSSLPSAAPAQVQATATSDSRVPMLSATIVARYPHDTSAFGPSHLEAFQRFVTSQRQLLAILRPAAERDQKLLATMTQQ